MVFCYLVTFKSPFWLSSGWTPGAVHHLQLVIPLSNFSPLICAFSHSSLPLKLTDSWRSGGCAVWQSVTTCCFLCSSTLNAWCLFELEHNKNALVFLYLLRWQHNPHISEGTSTYIHQHPKCALMYDDPRAVDPLVCLFPLVPRQMTWWRKWVIMQTDKALGTCWPQSEPPKSGPSDMVLHQCLHQWLPQGIEPLSAVAPA